VNQFTLGCHTRRHRWRDAELIDAILRALSQAGGAAKKKPAEAGMRG
jgi:hypothetical protein